MTDRTATARLDADGFVVITRSWSAYVERFPLAELDRWLLFYRRLWAGAPSRAPADRCTQPGPQARFYAPTLRALEDLRKTMVMP